MFTYSEGAVIYSQAVGMMLTKFDIIAAIIIIISLLLTSGYLHFVKEPQLISIDNTIGVKDLIKKVKDELVQAEQDLLSSGQQALFELKDFTLEMKFIVSEERTASGEVKYEVVTVGGEQKFSAEKT